MPKTKGKKRKTIKRLLKYVTEGYKLQLAVVLVSIIISALVGVIGTQFIKFLIDDFITPLLGSQSPDYTRLLNVVGPVGNAASRYITATIKGPNVDKPSWAAGQLIYNANNGNMEMFNSLSQVVDFYGDPMNHYGNTAGRPVGDFLTAGFVYFDTTLNKPIFYKRAGVWVDATGSQV